MNIGQITKNYEDYKKGLEQALRKLDDYKQNCSEELIFYKNETLKKPDKLQEESGQSVEEWEKGFEELYKSAMFPYTCVFPLLIIISHFVAKGRVSFPQEAIDVPTNPSVRDIYRLLSKLPENTAVFIFDSIGIGFMIDSFRDGEDGFASAFVSLENKTKIMDELVIIAKAIELGSFAECVSEINDMNTLEAVKFYIQEFKNSVRSHADFEYLNSVFDANLDRFIQWDNNSSSIIVDEDGIMDLFRKLLIKYIQLSPDFDSYSQACADKILNNPDYIDITSKLLAECEEELKRESNQNTPENNELHPLAFPYNHIKINKNQVRPFLEELYRTLSEGKQYIEKGCEEQFVFLLGGSDECPASCAPLLWLKQKNELQALLIALYGENAGNNPGWEVLKKYFWWKQVGRVPELANSSGSNISTTVKRNFVNIVKTAKKKASSNLS